MADVVLASELASLKRRLFRRVAVDGDCLIWMGARNEHGYGVIGFRGSSFGSHRAAWMVANGEIPNGLCVCHKCDVPACINPEHLFLGTHTDNMRDMVSKCRNGHNTHPEKFLGDRGYSTLHPEVYRGERNSNAKLTESDVRLIRQMAQTRTQPEVARAFGITFQTVSKIVRRTRWAHVA